jgi:predicted dehydrogenase
MTEKKDLEAVSVCTPNGLHAKPTIDAAKAGKHILCEKPMATNYADAKSMLEACERASRMDSSWFREPPSLGPCPINLFPRKSF